MYFRQKKSLFLCDSIQKDERLKFNCEKSDRELYTFHQTAVGFILPCTCAEPQAWRTNLAVLRADDIHICKDTEYFHLKYSVSKFFLEMTLICVYFSIL